ncbi:MAG: N-acetyl-gamma-glutamyl-phosphate reductase [Myxococcales bacterium]|nr:N-acetyl-gamma-glutamyl-phosphate reductase [Myxococcales bacterium]
MATAQIKTGIVGVSGYSGMELVRLLSRHPGFSVAWATTDRWAGKTLGEMSPLGPSLSSLVCISQEDGLGRFGDVELVFLCTPPEVSIELAPKVLAAGARVVDLSGGFRLAAEAYPRWYGFEHHAPALLSQAVYSLPEVTLVKNAEQLRQAKLVSNPGCYPTASSLPLLPLLRAGIVEPTGVIIDAKSGTTGAGRKGTEAMSFSEVADDFRAYRVLKHQHAPEIDRILALGGVPDVKVTFTAHLLPVRRGILATAYGRLADGVGADATKAAEAALQSFAAGRPFLHVTEPEAVTLHAVVGTNRVVMGVRADLERKIVVAFGAIDNLVKGAAGQALQNANLMFGWPESTALDTLVGHQP